MSKLIEQNPLKKSRFLKYSLLASISVGAIIAAPFEGMASSMENIEKPTDEHRKKFNNVLSQLKKNDDTASTTQETKNHSASNEQSNESGVTEEVAKVTTESPYEAKKRLASKLKRRPSTREKRKESLINTGEQREEINEAIDAFFSPVVVGGDALHTNSPESPAQTTPKEPEIVITEASPASTSSDSFVTASPSTPNTTPIFSTPQVSPIYTNVSSPTPTQYELTPDSKPNNGVGANNTPPKSGIAVNLPKKWEQEKRATQTEPIILPKPQLSTKKKSTEVAAEIMSHISGYSENATSKLVTITAAIEKISDKKARKKAQDIKKQIILQQKNIQKIESQAKEKADKIKELAQTNSTLYDDNKVVLSDDKRAKNKLQIGENIGKIEKLVKELESKTPEANKLSQKIYTLANKVVLTKPEIKAPATEMPIARSFLNQQEKLDANNPSKQSAQQQKAKARDIVNIRSDIEKKMQQISNTNTTPNKLQELELKLKVKTIEDKEQKQEVQKQLSKLKKQERAIKKAADEAQKIANNAKTETRRTELQNLQTKMAGYLTTVTNSNIEANIKNLENIFPTSSTPPSTATIPTKQSPKAVPVVPLTQVVQRILDELDEYGGYLVSNSAQQPPYLEVLSHQQAGQPESFDSGFGSLPNRNVPHTQTSNTNRSPSNTKVLTSQNLKPRPSFPSYQKDIYEVTASQYINILRNAQPNQSNQGQINVAIDSLVTEMKKLNGDQFSQKLDEIVNIPQTIYDSLLPKLYAVQQARVQETQEVYNQAEVSKSYNDNQQLKKASLQNASNILKQGITDLELLRQELNKEAQNLLKIRNAMPPIHHTTTTAESLIFDKDWKNPAPSSASPELDKKQSEYLDLADNNIFTQNLKQSDTLEALDLITSKQNITVAKSGSSRKSSVSGSIPEIQQPQSEKMHTKTLDVQNIDLELEKRLDYLDLGSSTFDLSKLGTEAKLQKVKNAKEFTEEQYSTVYSKNPDDQEQLDKLAQEVLNLSVTQSQLEQAQARDTIKTTASQPEIVRPVLKSTNKEPKSPRTLKQIEAKHAMEEFLNEGRLISFSELWRKNNDAPLLTDLGNQIFKGEKEIQKLEEDKKILESEVTSNHSISRSSSASSLSSDLSWDGTGDIGVGQYEDEDSCSTPDQSSSKTLSISNLVGSEEDLNEEFDELAKSEGLDTKSASDISDTEAEDILDGSALQEMLVSDDKSKSALPEEQEDEEVTESAIQETGKQLLPAPSNGSALALSDGREYEDDNDSGIDSESEEEAVEQLSDSSKDNLETTEVDTAISLKQEEKEEVKKDIAATAPTLNQGQQIIKNISSIIGTRLDASQNITAVAAGDEEEVRIKRGLWVRGMYGINNHGRVENINGYRGTNKGATIGFDVEIDNNIVGIAYSNVHSVFKFKNSKNNDKEIIDSHVVSIYGQKELPKDFALQALISASKNFIKDKTTYSYGDSKIRSNVKHRNHSYNAEALLNYNYLVKNNLVITPNIGLRYGKSRDGVYNETGINVQEIALTMKENNILSGIVGTKVKVPLKDALKFNNLGLTFQGAVEHNFKEKTQRINRVVKIFDTEFKQDYAIPKQPKTSYNLGTGITGSIKNTTISLDYNYYLNKHYRSHQGSVKLKVNL